MLLMWKSEQKAHWLLPSHLKQWRKNKLELKKDTNVCRIFYESWSMMLFHFRNGFIYWNRTYNSEWWENPFFSLDETSNYLKGLSLPGCFYVWVWVCGLKYYRYKTVIIYMRCESAHTFSQSTKLPCWFACTVCTYYTHISCNEMYFFSSFYSTYIYKIWNCAS